MITEPFKKRDFSNLGQVQECLCILQYMVDIHCLLFGLRVNLLVSVVVRPAVLQNTVLQSKGQISSQTQHYYI